MRVNPYFISKIFHVIALSVLSVTSFASFYQADTMAEYCHEYIKLIELSKPVRQYEAGVCSGYVASSIEIMDLSGGLCDRSNVNLDDVVRQYVTHIENNADLKKQTATYVLVEFLQERYACDEP